jgi:hypothetical protein
MTNKEKAEEAYKIVGDLPMLGIGMYQKINQAHYIIYGEYLKRSCLNSIRTAYFKIHQFIKAHK